MSIVTILSGGLTTKDPDASKAIPGDWDTKSLAPTVTIVTSVWTITALSPSTIDAALTKDSDAILTAAQATAALQRTVTGDSRVTLVRLIGGTLGQLYELENTITTSETPSQIKVGTVRVLIENS